MASSEKYDILMEYIEKVGEDLSKVMGMRVMHEDFVQLRDLMSHQCLEGGKRLRPVMGMLISQCMGGDYNETIKIITSCEMMHDGSISIDDVWDKTMKRRGKRQILLLATF